MDDSSVVGVLAEALAQHGYFGSRLVLIGGSSDSDEMDDYRFRISCQCGWSTLTAVSQADRAEGEKDFGTMHSAHVASVVAALPNIAIVPLPEPTDTKDYSEGGEGEDYLGWEVQHGPYFISVYDQGEVQVSYNGNVEEPISVDYATDLAAALLAAARAAGGQA